VDEAYVLANKDLIDVLFNKYRLKEHCESIRKYILLGMFLFLSCNNIWFFEKDKEILRRI